MWLFAVPHGNIEKTSRQLMGDRMWWVESKLIDFGHSKWWMENPGMYNIDEWIIICTCLLGILLAHRIHGGWKIWLAWYDATASFRKTVVVSAIQHPFMVARLHDSFVFVCGPRQQPILKLFGGQTQLCGMSCNKLTQNHKYKFRVGRRYWKPKGVAILM